MGEAARIFKTVWLWVAALASVVLVAGIVLFVWTGVSTNLDVVADQARCEELMFSEDECRQLFAHPEWASCRVTTGSFDRCADRLLPFERSTSGVCAERRLSLTECRQAFIDELDRLGVR
ncbi:MAG: hypothetical protein OXC31_11180 [Spirochaetaceae bacterium]|nr:hypothetical protein [Spirochaetaceae bacterium]